MMPEDEREVSYEAEEDGPMWNEGRDLPGESESADLLDDGEDDGD